MHSVQQQQLILVGLGVLKRRIAKSLWGHLLYHLLVYEGCLLLRVEHLRTLLLTMKHLLCSISIFNVYLVLGHLGNSPYVARMIMCVEDRV